MEKSVNNGGAFGALLTDSSKAFNCLSHGLSIAKLDAYAFDNSNENSNPNCFYNALK